MESCMTNMNNNDLRKIILHKLKNVFENEVPEIHSWENGFKNGKMRAYEDMLEIIGIDGISIERKWCPIGIISIEEYQKYFGKD
jgi:hypothetical protein